MEIFAVIEKVAAKTASGRQLAYTAAHVLKALELVSEKSIGRATLGRLLGLGEGTTRTMIKHLREAGMIRVNRRGISLAELGEQVLTQLHGMIAKGVEAPKGEHTVGEHNYAVLVKGASDNVRLGIEQRDAALVAGAKGATTLLYDGVHFQMPGIETPLDPSFTRFLVDRLKPEANDVIIIGTASTLSAAEIGAKTAALELLKEMTANPDTGYTVNASRPLPSRAPRRGL